MGPGVQVTPFVHVQTKATTYDKMLRALENVSEISQNLCACTAKM